MNHRRAAQSVVVLLALLGCRVGAYSGADRPDEGGGLGPPPPANFHCERGSGRREKSREPRQPDHVLFVVEGKPICDGLDFDHDGIPDEWDLLDDTGHIVDRAAVDKQGHTIAGDAGADAAR